MGTTVEIPPKAPPIAGLPWLAISWFGVLLVAGYIPVLAFLISTWSGDEMGHGYFVPVVAGYIVWQSRHELMSLEARPNWWGLAIVLYAGVQLFVATLGVEVFLARTSFVIALFGMVLLLGGTAVLKRLAFPLFLLFFMIPIPAIVYNRITFPLQILASQLATGALSLVGIPVLREGNILELPTQRLSVVEACSGIRSLLSLTFLSMVYGHFFEKKTWLRALLFVATIPIAILANGSRITVTGILSQVKPDLAEGFFHESTGWVIFMIAFAILIGVHHMIKRTVRYVENRRHS
jgi:exosortase